MPLLHRLFGPPSPEKFASAFVAEWKRQTGVVLKLDMERFLLFDEAAGYQTNLGNFYMEHCQLGLLKRRSHLRSVIRGVIESRQELPDDPDIARRNLRPKIWGRASMTIVDLDRRAKGETPSNDDDIPLYPLGEHLYTSVVYDQPGAMRSLLKSSLEGWGLTYYEALEIATENLAKVPVPVAQLGEGVYAFVTGDCYDSVRILMLDIIGKLEVKGDPVAAVPNRDLAIVTGSDDVDGLKVLVALSRESSQAPRPLCPLPLRLVDGEWEDWRLPRDHPHFRMFARLEMDFYGELYAEQKERLDAVFEREERDIFVASFSGVESNDDPNEAFSYCMWGDGIDTLLPRTDRIMLMSGGEVVASGTWEKVTGVAGHLLQEEVGYYPVRFRPLGFPDAEALSAIGMESQQVEPSISSNSND